MSADARLAFVHGLCDDLAAEASHGIDEMQASETGWIYCKILRFEVRRIFSPLHNIIGIGVRKKPPRTFHPNVKASARYNITDPYTILDDNSDLCIPACIIICLEHQLNGTFGRRISRNFLTERLELLNYKNLMSPLHKGILLEDVHKLETANFPYSDRMRRAYPAIVQYPAGISINIFRTYRLPSPCPGKETVESVSFFPKKLSTKHANPSALQIDLVLDTDDLREDLTPRANTGVSGFQSTKYYEAGEECTHVLAVTNLSRLLSSLKSRGWSNYKSKDAMVCRQCCRVFEQDVSYDHHAKYCRTFGGTGSNVKRRSCNKFIHRTRITLKSGKKVKHILRFTRGNLHLMIR